MMSPEDPQNPGAALTALVKLIKAVGFYPAGHPALQRAAQAARSALQTQLQGQQQLRLTIHKNGFLWEDKPFDEKNAILQKLASYFFARRVKDLVFLPGTTSRDLINFSSCLILTPARIHALGGLGNMLQRLQVSTTWINKTDLEEILREKAVMEQAREQLEAAGGENAMAQRDQFILEEFRQGGDQTAQPQSQGMRQRPLTTIFQELHQERRPDRFRQLAMEAVGAIRSQLDTAPARDIFRILLFFAQSQRRKSFPVELKKSCQEALVSLGHDQPLGFIISHIGKKQLSAEYREGLFRILAAIGDTAARELVEQMAAEEDGRLRRLYSEALVRFGPSAKPILLPYLDDDRWFVQRNIAGIFGEIGDADVLHNLVPLLDHEDVRVRRETIRALGRIGGPHSGTLLLELLEREEPETLAQILLALGNLHHVPAVPALVRLIRRPDPFRRLLPTKKNAVRALGEIGDEAGVVPLIKILRRKHLWKGDQYLDLKRAAVMSLAEIGTDRAVKQLEKTSRNRNPELARTAIRALRLWEKGAAHAS